MDPVTLSFYGMVCGCLSLLAPHIGGSAARLALGAAVGVAAALALPPLRGLLGL